MTARRMAAGTTLAAAAGLWLLAASLLWRTDVPADLDLPDVDPATVFSAAHLRESADYVALPRALWVGTTCVQLAVLALFVLHRRGLAARLQGGRILRSVLLLALVLAAVWLARLPFAAVGHWWRRRHGLSRQGYEAWLVAPWLELAVAALVALLALLAAIALARRLGRWWWIAGWPLLAALATAVVVSGPLVLAPRLEPLADRRLAREIRGLARQQGLGSVEVAVKDARALTTTANAEVAGVGPSRRVVLWNTLLDGRFTRPEVRAVAAHELAHVSRRHLWKGLGWFALLSLPALAAVAEVTRRFGGLGDPAVVPVAVLAVVVAELALLPVANALSRRYEAEADWVALETTRDPAAAEALIRRFSRTGLAQPDPPRWAYALRSTHPSPVERIALARAWAASYRSGAEPRAGS